jgi:hypothetical protein
MREYIAKPPDPCTEKAMMPQINLIKLTFINAARESAYQCRQGERGTCGSRKFEFRKNTNMRRERHCGIRDCPSGRKSRSSR